MKPFVVGSMPALTFGQGCFASLTRYVESNRGSHLALVTGEYSFRAGKSWQELKKSVVSWDRMTDFSLKGEPSPEFVDTTAETLRNDPPDLVLAIGGGSVMDAAKAIAAMVPVDGSVENYLEGVGDRNPTGVTLPVVAVPTTSGTGSEVTKNAVISRVGPGGYKKSLRHDNYVPTRVYIDPELILGCPLEVTRFAGLDAITQLLEAYVSTDAGNVTDIYALEGLRLAGAAFPALASGEDTVELRAQMALASYYSGVALANAGLGIVHGLASPLGAVYPVSHGAACATLLAESTAVVIDRLRKAASGDESAHTGGPGLGKYSRAAAAIIGRDFGSIVSNCRNLVALLRRWVDECEVPKLAEYGMSEDDVGRIAALSGIKNTPVHLTTGDVEAILKSRL